MNDRAIRSTVSECNGVKMTGMAFNVNSDSKVSYIKDLIHGKSGMDKNSFRLSYGGMSNNLCPSAKLIYYNIKNNDSIWLIVNLGSGATPPDTLLSHVSCELYPFSWLHNCIKSVMIKDNAIWDKNLTTVIWDYLLPVYDGDNNLLLIDSEICNSNIGRSERIDHSEIIPFEKYVSKNNNNNDGKDSYYQYEENERLYNLCIFCEKWKYHRPVMNEKMYQKYLDNVVQYMKEYCYDKYNNNSCKDYFGLYIKLGFSKYTSKYNQEWTILYDLEKLTKLNIMKYIFIYVNCDGFLYFLNYDIVDTDTSSSSPSITIKVLDSSLESAQIQKLFAKNNGKLNVDILIKEKQLPAIYTGKLKDKGQIIADIHLNHCIYQMCVKDI